MLQQTNPFMSLSFTGRYNSNMSNPIKAAIVTQALKEELESVDFVSFGTLWNKETADKDKKAVGEFKRIFSDPEFEPANAAQVIDNFLTDESHSVGSILQSVEDTELEAEEKQIRLEQLGEFYTDRFNHNKKQAGRLKKIAKDLGYTEAAYSAEVYKRKAENDWQIAFHINSADK